MTNTPDLASMMAKLDWKFRQQDNVDIEAQAIINDIEFYTTDRKWYIGKDIAQGTCTSVLDGINQIELAFVKYIEPFFDLTKLQQPEPFWKPIEQCPKEHYKKYFLLSAGEVRIGFYDKTSKLFYEEIPYILNSAKLTHFAEIPPYEVKP